MRKLSFDEIFNRMENNASKGHEHFPIYVIAENIRSLYNVGAIFRTSDAGGVAELYLSGYTGKPPRNEISKTALGADKSVPWQYFDKTTSIIENLKKRKIPIVILEHTDQSKIYTEVAYDFPMCLVIGNEVEGVSDETVKMADLAIEIPMHGIKHSLNVSVAYGIVLFHIVSQYKQHTES